MSTNTMVREICAQSIESTQRVHDLRVCDLIREIRRGQSLVVSTDWIVASLIDLRQVMAEDTNTLLAAVSKR